MAVGTRDGLQSERWLARQFRGVELEHAVITVLALTELGLTGLVLSGDLMLQNAVASHVAAVSVAAFLLFANVGQADGDRRTMPAIAWLLLAIAGPASVLALLVVVPFTWRLAYDTAALKAWYERLANASGADQATHIYDQVLAGRVMRFDAELPDNFQHVIETGSLSERQAVLGLIARRFHPDYGAALILALRSEEPLVRVQAAAVVARVRPELKLRIKELTTGARDAGGFDRLKIAHHLLELADCPIVDRADADVCRSAATERLGAHFADRNSLVERSGAFPASVHRVADRYLLNHGRYSELRVTRRVRRVTCRGYYRVRRVRKGFSPA